MIILDTSVIIDIRRGRREVKKIIEKHTNQSQLRNYGISAITIEELYVGLGYTHQKYGESVYEKNKSQIDMLLEDYEIFDVTRLILEKAGFLKGQLMGKGISIDIQDLIIGTTAEIVKAEKIITRNPDHFKPFKIPIISYQIQ